MIRARLGSWGDCKLLESWGLYLPCPSLSLQCSEQWLGPTRGALSRGCRDRRINGQISVLTSDSMDNPAPFLSWARYLEPSEL